MFIGKQKCLMVFALTDKDGAGNVKLARKQSLWNVEFAHCIAVKHRIEV